jgi:hypothetical protein
VIDDAHLLVRTTHAQPFLTQSGERLRVVLFVNFVQIGIEQHVLLVDPAYRMRRNKALIQGL